MVLEVQARNYINEAQLITYQIRNNVRFPEDAARLQKLNLRLQLILEKLLPEAFGSVLYSYGTEKSKQWVYANTEKLRVEDPLLFDKISQILSRKYSVTKAVFDQKADIYEREVMRHTRQRVQESLSLTPDQAIKALDSGLSVPLNNLHNSRYRYVDINIRTVARILTDNYKLFRWRDSKCQHLSMKQRCDMKRILQYVKDELAKFEKNHKEIKSHDLYKKLHHLVFTTLTKQDWIDKFGNNLDLISNMLRFLPYTYHSLHIIKDTITYDRIRFLQTVARWIDYNKGDLRVLRDFKLIQSVQPYVRHVNLSSLFDTFNYRDSSCFSISQARMYSCNYDAATVTGMTEQGIIDFVNGFKKIESLHISYNGSFTQIPDQILVKLKSINLSHTVISQFLRELPNATYLDLSSTNLSTFVTYAPNLTHLDLSCTEITRLGSLPPNLTYLNLSNTTIETLPRGGGMATLKSLILEGCNQLKQLPSPSDAVSLEELMLLENEQLTALPFYPRLKSLFCEVDQIPDLPDYYKGLRKLMGPFDLLEGMVNLKVFITRIGGIEMPLDCDSLTVLCVYRDDERPDSSFPEKYRRLIYRDEENGYNFYDEFDIDGEPINKERVKRLMQEYQRKAAQAAEAEQAQASIEVLSDDESSDPVHATTPVSDND